MADSDEGTSDSGDDEMQSVVYTCRKCEGKEFTTKDQMDRHREYHKNLINSRRRERRRERRGASPAPSTMTTSGSLFAVASVVRDKPGPRSRKKRKAAKARQRATDNYNKQAEKNMNVHYKGA